LNIFRNVFCCFLPVLFYGVLGSSFFAFFGKTKKTLFEILLVGFILPQLLFCIVTILTYRGFVGLYFLGATSLLWIYLVIKNAKIRGNWVQIVKNSNFKELCLFLFIVGTIGFPFLTTPALAPWGVANEDLFDALKGTHAILFYPHAVSGYNEPILLFITFGQYSSSTLSNILELFPEGLLGDYWHLIFLFSLLTLGVYRLARDIWKLDKQYSVLSSLVVGCGSMMVTTIYNGHEGSTLFMPLAIYIFLKSLGQIEKEDRIGILCSFLFIMMSYGYPFIFYGGALFLYYISFKLCSYRPRLFSSTNPVAIIVFILGIFSLWAIYPYFESLRFAAEERMRSWEISMRLEMLPIYWGFNATGLAYHETNFQDLFPDPYNYVLCGILFLISLIGCFKCKSEVARGIGVSFLVICILFGIGVRCVVQDSYYFYKVLYISFPIVAIWFANGLQCFANLKPILRIRYLWLGIGLSLVIVNISGNVRKVVDFSRTVFNVRMADIKTGMEEILFRIQPIASGNTRDTWTNILEVLRERLLFGIQTENPWRFDNMSKRRIHSYEYIKLKYTFEESQHFVFPKEYPEILKFEGIDYPVSWENDLWKVIDTTKSPRIIPDDWFEVMRYPDSLNNEPFRWVNKKLQFKITHWPQTLSRLRFYAEAGYGSTSGLFDLSVKLNDSILDRRIVSRSGEWLDFDFDPGLIKETNILEFSGTPLPGPQLEKRELKFLKARIARIRIAPKGSADPEPNLIFNSRDDITQSNTEMRSKGVDQIALGSGWENQEIYQNEKFRWLEDKPAKLFFYGRTESSRTLVIHGHRGPILPADAQLFISFGKRQWSVPISNDRIVVHLEKPLAATEEMVLWIKPSAESLSNDPRRLNYQVFSVRFENEQ
jgi:hypothetical protein